MDKGVKLYIVRHGQTRENLRRILQGHLPGELTELGLEQAHAVAERLEAMGTGATRIVSSDLKRTMDTAAIIARRVNLPVTPMRLLRERDWGECTGMPIDEARFHYYQDGKWKFPASAESEEELYTRAGKVLETLQRDYPGETLIVVTHGQLARNVIAAHFKCPVHEVTTLVNGEVRLLTIKPS